LLKYSIKALLPSIRRAKPFFYDITIVLKAEITCKLISSD
jgi:hypothetical protein